MLSRTILPTPLATLVKDIVYDFVSFAGTRGLGIGAYFASVQKLMAEGDLAIEFAAYYGIIAAIGNIYRMLLNAIVNHAAAAHLKNDITAKQDVYRALFFAALLPTILTTGTSLLYTSFLLPLLPVSAAILEMMQMLPLQFMHLTFALMWMSVLSNYAGGTNERGAFMAIFVIGAFVMFGAMFGFQAMGLQESALLWANFTQMALICVLSYLHAGFLRRADGLVPAMLEFNKLFGAMQRGLKMNWEGFQPMCITAMRLGSSASIVFLLNGVGLKAFQFLFNIASFYESLSTSIVEQRILVFVTKCFAQFKDAPDMLALELKRGLGIYSALNFSLPLIGGMLACTIPNFFDFLLSSDSEKNHAIKTAAISDSKWALPFVTATLFMVNATSRGIIFSVKGSSLPTHKKVNQLSTVAGVFFNVLFPMLAKAFSYTDMDQVTSIWMALIIPQALLATTQLSLAANFLKQELARLNPARAPARVGKGLNSWCCLYADNRRQIDANDIALVPMISDQKVIELEESGEVDNDEIRIKRPYV